MPIKRHLYPPDWKAISAAIRARAGNACECSGQCGAEHPRGRCGAPNRAHVVRNAEAPWLWHPVDVHEHECWAFGCGDEVAWVERDSGDYACGGHVLGAASKIVRVVLTVAHLDHEPSHNDPANLLCCCQRCHLRIDRFQHAANARATRRGRKAVGELPGTEPKEDSRG